jgi:hypothetical protein
MQYREPTAKQLADGEQVDNAGPPGKVTGADAPRKEPITMIDDNKILTNKEAIAQIEAAYATSPNPLRDLCEQVVREGDDADPPLGDMKAVLERHFLAPKQ